METYTSLKSFVDNPEFHDQRIHSLKSLDFDTIDEPIVELIKDLARLDYCFTLQSCYGHFVNESQKDHHNLAPLSSSHISDEIEYRIAYIAICLDNNEKGRNLLNRLKELSTTDEKYIQIGCANWFWDQQLNSFVLQVEPERFKFSDKITIAYEEAIHLEKIRDEFYLQFTRIISEL